MTDEATPLLNAYMACALSGVEGPARSHVDFLSDVAAEVCAKHGIFLYQPRKKTDPVNNPDIPDEQVYQIDRRKVALSDLVVMLCDYPSTGSGQENEIAAQVGIPVILLIKEGKKVSRMVTGSYASNYTIEYKDPDDLKEKLDTLLAGIVPGLVARRRSMDGFLNLQVGKRVRELRHARRIEVEELAQILGVKPAFVTDLETSPERVSNCSVVHLRRIAAALGASISFLLEGVEQLSGFEAALRKSAGEFLASRRLPESELQPLMAFYSSKQELPANAPSARGAIPTTEEWKAFYEAMVAERAQRKLFGEEG